MAEGWYARKVNRDFAKCKTKKEADALIGEYERWNDYLEYSAFAVCSAGALSFFASATLVNLGNRMPSIASIVDKIGHFGKGFGASWVTGKLFNELYQRWHNVNEADDDIKATLKTTIPRVAAEGASTAGSAFGWEILQRDVPAFPGSVYDEWDIFADACGHVANSTVEYLTTWRRSIQNNAYENRLKELNKKPTKKRSLVTGFGGASFRYDSDLAATA